MAAVLGPNCPGCAKQIPAAVIKQAVTQQKDIRCTCQALRSWKTLVELYEAPGDGATIAEAKAYIKMKEVAGVSCPCCGQRVIRD